MDRFFAVPLIILIPEVILFQRRTMAKFIPVASNFLPNTEPTYQRVAEVSI